jgi:hypothetical protein
MKQTLYSMLPVSAMVLTLQLTASALATAEAAKFTPAQLKEDLRIARHALEEGHPGLYRLTKKAEMDRAFDEAEKSLDHPMDFYEFYRVMALPVAAIKCGHTDVSIDPDVLKETECLPWLPFDVTVLEGRPYIFRDYAKAGTLAGREIQSINGVAASRIISTMLAAESQDGDIQTSRQRVIGQHFELNLIALLGLRAPYNVMLAGSGSGRPEKVQLAGLKHDEMVALSKRLYPQDQGRVPSKGLRFFDDGKIALLRYSFFGIDIDEARDFLKRSFEAIQSKRSKTLILDMRGNLGGEGEIGSLLFSYLVDQPFKYYDDLIMNKSSGTSYSFAKYTDKHRDLVVPPGLAELRADGKGHQTNDPLIGLQSPGQPGFKGPLYILINGRCFSSTAEFLTEIHFHHRATFIGEESAGAYYGNNSGDVERITLPNTRLGLFIPFISCYMSVGGTHDHDPAHGIIPDFPVKYTIADMLAGADKDLPLALELSRKSP